MNRASFLRFMFAVGAATLVLSLSGWAFNAFLPDVGATQVSVARAVPPQREQAAKTYFDDFSSYPPGQPPAGWLLRGSAETITPTIQEVGGSGPDYRQVFFPEVLWEYWDKWMIKDDLYLTGSYTVTVKMNFQTEMADRAGLTIAWDDAHWNRLDIQPNVYWDDIEFRITYIGPITYTYWATWEQYIPIDAFTDYWLRVEATDFGPGHGQAIISWSTDDITFRQVITATGLPEVAGRVGISTAGPHMPPVFFDDFTVKQALPVTYSVSGRVMDSTGYPIAGVTISNGAGKSALTGEDGYYTLEGLAPGTYTLTPSLSGYTFWPASHSVSVPPGQTGIDFEAQPPPKLILCLFIK
jgi:regulation of enolase protein 1 (concanavalin A-like superfamily)